MCRTGKKCRRGKYFRLTDSLASCLLEFDFVRQKQQADATDDEHQPDRSEFDPRKAADGLALRLQRHDGQKQSQRNHQETERAINFVLGHIIVFMGGLYRTRLCAGSLPSHLILLPLVSHTV